MKQEGKTFRTLDVFMRKILCPLFRQYDCWLERCRYYNHGRCYYYVEKKKKLDKNNVTE